MPIHRVGYNSYAPRLIHQGSQHGYTGGVPNTSNYGSGPGACHIAQPNGLLVGRNQLSTLFAGYAEGLITGWKGKILGVINPAKVMGIAAESISKVKGVVSA